MGHSVVVTTWVAGISGATVQGSLAVRCEGASEEPAAEVYGGFFGKVNVWWLAAGCSVSTGVATLRIHGRVAVHERLPVVREQLVRHLVCRRRGLPE